MTFLDQIKVGKISDHSDIEDSLNDLNDLISCSEDRFELSESSCEASRCKGLYETVVYSVPSCVQSVERVNVLFQNFKDYFTTEEKLIFEMNEELNLQEDSPKITYQKAHS